MINKRIKQFIILTIGICCFYGCKNCEQKVVAYTEEEPYKDFEYEQITLEYSVENNKLYYERKEGAIILGENPKFNVNCKVINKGEQGGEFELYATITSQGDKIEINEKKFIPAQSVGEFVIQKEINPFSFKADVNIEDWGIKPPTLDVKKEVTKYKTITKYKPCNTCEGNCN